MKNVVRVRLDGKRFGRWRVLSFSRLTERGSWWLCRCSCRLKTEREVRGGALQNGTSKSCGCSLVKYELTGRRFGMLVVERRLDGAARWLCRCDCGNTKVVQSQNIRSGRNKSCGCSTYAPRVAAVGETFGKLTVTEVLKRGRRRVICSCGSNSVLVVATNQLTRKVALGATPSCGCVPRRNHRLLGEERWSANNLYRLAKTHGVTLSVHIIRRRILAGESPRAETFWRPCERWEFGKGKGKVQSGAKAKLIAPDMSP